MATRKRTAPQEALPEELVTGSVEETQAFGERLGRALRAGDVVALFGELGSGKTTLIQGIAQGLGRDAARIKSPTFVLMREYPPVPSGQGAARPGDREGRAGGAGGGTPLVHIDGYRLSGAPAAAWLDIEQIFSPHKITLIEWAERFEGLLPASYVGVRLRHVSAHRRAITVAAHGARAEEIARVAQAAASVEQPAPSADGKDST